MFVCNTCNSFIEIIHEKEYVAGQKKENQMNESKKKKKLSVKEENKEIEICGN